MRVGSVGNSAAAAALATALLLILAANDATPQPAWAQTDAPVLKPAQEKYLREHVWAVLGTGRKDGSPQLSMIAYDYDGKDIVISIKSYTAKWKNVLRQPKVALLVHDGRKQLIIYGTAEGIARDPERLALTRRLWRRLGGTRHSLQGDDQKAIASLDAQKRTVLRITPEKAFMNE